MNEYIQKITSRSYPLMPADNPASRLIVPTKPEIATDSFEFSDIEPSGTISPAFSRKDDSAPNPVIQKDVVETGSKISDSLVSITQVVSQVPPASDETPSVTKILHTTEEIFHTPVIQPSLVNDETQKPGPTIIERIQQRSVQQTTIFKEPSEIKYFAERTQPMEHDVERIAVLGNYKIEQNQSAVFGSQQVSPPAMTIHPIRNEAKQIQNEKLMPVIHQDALALPPNKTEQVNKLIIGKITVEVVNPIQAVKPKEIVNRTIYETKSGAPEFNSNTKLSFGLGQL